MDMQISALRCEKLTYAHADICTHRNTHTCTCPAGCPQQKDVLLFLGSPRCANLDELQRCQLFLSDFPLHDMGRDFVLLAEQRQAEADLKEKFEKLTIELKVGGREAGFPMVSCVGL